MLAGRSVSPRDLLRFSAGITSACQDTGNFMKVSRIEPGSSHLCSKPVITEPSPQLQSVPFGESFWRELVPTTCLSVYLEVTVGCGLEATEHCVTVNKIGSPGANCPSSRAVLGLRARPHSTLWAWEEGDCLEGRVQPQPVICS